MSEHTRASALEPPPADLEALRRDHPRWRVSYKMFADGPRYDAIPLDEGRPRLVVATAAGMGEQIAAVEAGTWAP